MCGINGFTFQDESLIKQMNACVKHRGPDDDGVFMDDNISLGHTRLSIIDLSENGHQPMTSHNDRYVMVYNGELYNFHSIRKDLEKKGHTFRSDSDSEVFLAAYEVYGAECFKSFNGMFALAIWDKQSRKLLLARDRVGIKPLYYYFDNKNLIFSSEIKSILKHQIKREVNKDALNVYLRMLYVPGPMTMFSNIYKLKPAHYLVWDGDKIKETNYWKPDFSSELTNYDEAKEMIKETLFDSVKLRQISDRPVGVFLSGGVDSTIITGLVAEQKKDEIKTFAVDFDVKHDKFNSDAKLAKETSAYFGTDHHTFLVTGKDASRELENVIAQMDEPVANTTQIATYLLAKHTRDHVVVALGGDGGDELFGGYERYALSQKISRFQNSPFIWRSLVKSALPILKKFKPGASKLITEPGVDRYLTFMAQKELILKRFVKDYFIDTEKTKNIYSHFFSDQISDPENEFMWGDIKTWLVDESLMRTDKMSMSVALEERVPFLDHRLIELAMKIPSAWKINKNNSKHILQDAMQKYLPEHILGQPKRGWFSPTSEWLRGPLKNQAFEILSPAYNHAANEFFDFEVLHHMLDDHIEKRGYYMNQLWAIITFQIWYKTYISSSS